MLHRLFAVRCGSMLKAVLASDPEEAAVLALRRFADERDGDLPARLLAAVIVVAEEGRPQQDNFVGEARDSFERAGLPTPAGIGTSGPFSAN